MPSILLKKTVLITTKKWSQFVSMFMLEVLFLSGKEVFAERLLEQWIDRFLSVRTKPFKSFPVDVPKQARTKAKTISFDEVFHRFFEAIGPLQIRPFLAFGTLLGYVRENGFIQWDRDIDIGLFKEEVEIDQLKQTLQRAGFRIVEDFSDSPPYKLKCAYGDSPLIEMVFLEMENGYRITYGRLMGHSLKRHRKPFSLKSVQFKQVTVYVPDPPEAFLTENYGDWQNPQPIYSHIFHSKLTDYHTSIIRFYAKRSFCAQLLEGNALKIAHFLDLFVHKYPQDPFWTSLRKRLTPLLP
ncbi:MAG: LicD family protein [Lunatimonas sp.]|uniref:LicD family protein n=1 Tax=Lunatimonas sp. TaxID=2060141 RepID=UPI00263A50B6|nr:LicD family protein [Lunatimonas sp.]MCC5936526.1 LicD family protein [Lunatimonas sp.]